MLRQCGDGGSVDEDLEPFLGFLIYFLCGDGVEELLLPVDGQELVDVLLPFQRVELFYEALIDLDGEVAEEVDVGLNGLFLEGDQNGVRVLILHIKAALFFLHLRQAVVGVGDLDAQAEQVEESGCQPPLRKAVLPRAENWRSPLRLDDGYAFIADPVVKVL